MLCLLPSTALALSGFDPVHIPNASGLFNLMRNLGGAIGLALIDTVLEQRAPAHIAAIVARLQAGDAISGPSGRPADRAFHRRSDRRGSMRRRVPWWRHWSSAPGSSPPLMTLGS